jgi:hypothetical protein
MPPNTIYVGRPSLYGNPFDETVPLTQYMSLIRETLKTNPTFLEPLKGKDLACWCRLDFGCHADVLIKIIAEHE